MIKMFIDDEEVVCNNLIEINEEMLSRLTVGSHYKVEIAYISNDSTGYYSTVGIVKYTTHPTMEMPGLSTNVINMHRYSYIGKYSQVAYEYKEIPVSVRDYKPNLYYKKNGDGFIHAIDSKIMTFEIIDQEVI